MANFPPNPLHEHLQHLNALRRRSDAMPVFERKGDAQLAAACLTVEDGRKCRVVAQWQIDYAQPSESHVVGYTLRFETD